LLLLPKNLCQNYRPLDATVPPFCLECEGRRYLNAVLTAVRYWRKLTKVPRKYQLIGQITLEIRRRNN
jgi:hypothetical protein